MSTEGTPPPSEAHGPAPRDRDDVGEMLAHLAQAARELADVDHALDRLDAGTYGTCEVCGAQLDATRLEAEPTVRTCVGH
ncbi:MAG: TraR/DksA C4-type zinc finger protein [Acidimicrobiales bacterium]